MKLLIISPPFSRKRVLAEDLRRLGFKKVFSLNEEIFRFTEEVPDSLERLHGIRNKVNSLILELDTVIYLTDYLSREHLKAFKESGFYLLQLTLSLEEALQSYGASTVNSYYQISLNNIDNNFAYQKSLEASGYCDLILKAKTPRKELLEVIEKITTISQNSQVHVDCV